MTPQQTVLFGEAIGALEDLRSIFEDEPETFDALSDCLRKLRLIKESIR